ncbi:MAG: hypothetical protein QXT20_00690 [Candidatus Woesearchaeota archaeon]
MGRTLKVFVVLAILALLSVSVLGKMGDSPSGIGAQQPGSQQLVNSSERVEAQVEVKNAGENSQIRTEEQTQLENPGVGAQISNQERETVKIAVSNNKIELSSGNSTAKTSMIVRREKTAAGEVLRVNLSNGRNAEIKVMPDVASERALERLRLKVCSAENNCTIELKEVGSGNRTIAAYEVQVERHARILGIFQAKVQEKVQVDAENGEVVKVQKPWWSFLAFGSA